ncbi:disulfide bond formation protein B [Priestia megaterium]|uniref:disulfide bond formation protein B n=1 Tax=Priestia megaterium TaxID=1404 RepID=UPI0032429494
MKKLTLGQVLVSSFIISIMSVIISLYYSEVVKLAPCELCWYQRIFMYPLPLLCIMAMISKDNKSINYIRVFSIVGALIALYQYILQVSDTKSSFCGIGANCADIQIQYLGFITIPLLSFFAFIAIFVITMLSTAKTLNEKK